MKLLRAIHQVTTITPRLVTAWEMFKMIDNNLLVFMSITLNFYWRKHEWRWEIMTEALDSIFWLVDTSVECTDMAAHWADPGMVIYK